jgi:hypothetical protein
MYYKLKYRIHILWYVIYAYRYVYRKNLELSIVVEAFLRVWNCFKIIVLKMLLGKNTFTC